MRPMHPFWQRIKPPHVAFISLALGVALAKTGPNVDMVPRSIWPVGFVFLAFGLGLPVWALLQFRRAGTHVEPGHVPTALVTTGPYRWTRNPMYLGLTLLLLGGAILTNRTAALVSPALFVIVIHAVFVPWEERTAEATFGDAFRAFKDRTPRWLI